MQIFHCEQFGQNTQTTHNNNDQKHVVHCFNSNYSSLSVDWDHHLQLFSRYIYCTLSVLGSRVWPFGVTWRQYGAQRHTVKHCLWP